MKTLVLLAAITFLQILAARAAETIYNIPLKDIDGNSTSLKPYQGKVLLIVNVASKCGFTPQYAALEAIYQKYKDQGLVVLGFPCNQFAHQEPGTDLEIKQFCTSKYDVTFPMFDKIEVNGASRHPLYALLVGRDSPFSGDIDWSLFDPGLKKEFEELAAGTPLITDKDRNGYSLSAWVETCNSDQFLFRQPG